MFQNLFRAQQQKLITSFHSATEYAAFPSLPTSTFHSVMALHTVTLTFPYSLSTHITYNKMEFRLKLNKGKTFLQLQPAWFWQMVFGISLWRCCPLPDVSGIQISLQITLGISSTLLLNLESLLWNISLIQNFILSRENFFMSYLKSNLSFQSQTDFKMSTNKPRC